MTEEEYFIKNYPDSCYGDRPLSPYWDFFQEGVEFGERQSEKKIEELEKALEGYKENATWCDKCKRITEAKEHIRTLISCLIDWVQEGDKDYCYIADAEQFLKDLEK